MVKLGSPGTPASVFLLPTKLYRPRLDSRTVQRSHLLAQLNENLDRKLTLICAPAGYGKSTLTAQWLDDLSQNATQSAVHHAWLSLDKGDNDVRRFLVHFVGAIQMACPDSCRDISALLQGEALAPLEMLIDTLIYDVTVLPADRLYLVLDDCHVLEQAAVLELLTAFINHHPQQVHLILLSRIDPPLPLARLRLAGGLLELRARDLRFRREEMQTLFERHKAMHLSPERLDLLEQRSEGWVALLQLALLSLRDESDPDSFLQAFEHNKGHLTSYLLEEIIGQESETVQEFLLHTSLLDRFSAPLCDAMMTWVSREPVRRVGVFPVRGAEILRYLREREMFLIPLDGESAWFRYHHLFQDLLRRRLVESRQPLTIARLHRQACRWFEAQGLLEEAFSHALTSGDNELVAQLVEDHAQELLNLEDIETLRDWMQQLPEDLVQQRPGLLFVNACLLQVSARNEAMRPVLERVEALLEISDVSTTKRATLHAGVAALECVNIFIDGDMKTALALAEKARRDLPDAYSWLRGKPDLVWACAKQSLGEAEGVLAELHNEILRFDNINKSHQIHSLHLWLAISYVHQIDGHLPRLAESGTVHLQKAAAFGRENSKGWAHFNIGYALYGQHELDQALTHFRAAVSRRYLVHHAAVRISLMGLAMIHATRGQTEAVQSYVQEAIELAQKANNFSSLDRVRSMQVRLALVVDDVEQATRLVNDHIIDFEHRAENDLDPPFHTLAWLRMAQGTTQSLAEADRLLSKLRRQAADTHHTHWLINALTLHSLVLCRQGKHEAWQDALAEALALAEPRNSLQPFVEPGPAMADLLRQLAERDLPDSQQNFLARLLQLLDAAPLQPMKAANGNGYRHSPDTGWPPPSAASLGTVVPTMTMIEQLTSREEQVLDLLARHYSYNEIAAELFISPATVKKHASNIYSKLAVSRRSQAVWKARQLGILTADD